MPPPESDSDDMDIDETIIESQFTPNGRGPPEGDLTSIYAQQYNYLHTLHQENAASEDAVKAITNVLEQSSLLAQSERTVRESLYGGNVLYLCAQISQRQAQSLDTNLCAFDLQSFADGIKRAAVNAETGRVEFGRLAKRTRSMFKRAPTMSYMYGSFKPTELPRKEPKERQVRQKRVAVEKKEPEKVTTVQANDEGNDKAVQHLKKALNSLIRNNGGRPLGFFETMVNPHSFHYTVENIFHLSFLMKNNLFAVELRNNLPFIIKMEKKNNQEIQKERKNQCIVSINQDLWKTLIEVFDIKEPMIQPLV